MKKIKKTDVINFWVDYIEVIWTSKSLESLEFDFNYDYKNKQNNYKSDKLFPWFLIKKVTKVMNYQFKIILQKNWFDCLAYHKWQNNWDVSTYDFISVYWVAFKVFKNITDIFDFLNKHLDNNKIKRFDLAIDLDCTVDYVYKHINPKKKKQKWSIFLDDKWNKQTFYIWEKKKTMNRYKLFRCYNKIDDIKRTWRQKLYTEYLKKWLVTRIELEFRSELTKDMELNDLQDNNYIYAIFISYIKQYTELFDDFKYEKIKLRRLIKEIDINELKYNEILKRRYLNTFLWYSRNILSIWSCPINILLDNNIISQNTINNILSSITLNTFDIDEYQKIIKKDTGKKYIYNNLFLDPDEDE